MWDLQKNTKPGVESHPWHILGYFITFLVLFPGKNLNIIPIESYNRLQLTVNFMWESLHLLADGYTKGLERLLGLSSKLLNPVTRLKRHAGIKLW